MVRNCWDSELKRQRNLISRPWKSVEIDFKTLLISVVLGSGGTNLLHKDKSVFQSNVSWEEQPVRQQQAVLLGQTHAEGSTHSRVSSSISGKDFSLCVPTASPRHQGGCSGLPLWLNRKHLASDPQGEGKPACVGRVQTGTCCYFLSIPTPLTSSLRPMGVSDVQNHIQSTELARLWRHCNHCNAEFIFPVTIQPKESMAQRVKHLDKVLHNHSSQTNPEMAVLYF